MNNSIKIVSDGIGNNTKVFNVDGKTIQGITKIEIEPITCKSIITARLTFEFVELEIVADWSNHPLKKWTNRKTGK